ncbi:valyl-tRNA synthetase [Lysinibacillus sp. CNPSo 3705]|uniref:valyl-tRNA synthetase n=1 Tax=Lysinibacillus sp. CNPSo 3705 TaxID=3028148 RepID=UPI002363745A|nr:valyl-tRNA synthetase [Lysinibacillus sp. CNPSo 3705]MDD1502187.1 valyl-tRNA synthetase [Lysinibacillus sp. CNPSo 3705]
MSETFCFPGYGSPTEIADVQIMPRWQTMQLEDSLRLMGIYHITAHVRFDFQDMKAFLDDEELVQIDALDIQGDTGYFEYAVPLNVDLPKEASIEDLMVKDVRPKLMNQMCQLEWTVTSIFNEPEPAFALEKQPVTVNALAQLEKGSPIKETAAVVASIQEEKPAAVVASAQEEKTIAVMASTQEEKPAAEVATAQVENSTVITTSEQEGKSVTFNKEKSEAIVASDKKEKTAPAEQKTILRESSSHIVVRESSSWHEVPSMIWDLTEDYTPLKVRVSNDFIQK